MKLITKILIIFSLSIVHAYSACDFKVELGVKRKAFESLELTGPPLPLEYEDFDVYGILADDVCPDQKLKEVAIEYKFLKDELVAINLIALNDDRNLVSESLIMMNLLEILNPTTIYFTINQKEDLYQKYQAQKIYRNFIHIIMMQ